MILVVFFKYRINAVFYFGFGFGFGFIYDYV